MRSRCSRSGPSPMMVRAHVAPVPVRQCHAANRDVQPVHVGERAVVDELDRLVERRDVLSAHSEIARVGGVVHDDPVFGCGRGARLQQLVDGAIHRDGQIGAAARPAFDASGDRRDHSPDRSGEFRAREFGEDLMHVEDQARAAVAAGSAAHSRKSGVYGRERPVPVASARCEAMRRRLRSTKSPYSMRYRQKTAARLAPRGTRMATTLSTRLESRVRRVPVRRSRRSAGPCRAMH